jgi:hypothetical protein
VGSLVIYLPYSSISRSTYGERIERRLAQRILRIRRDSYIILSPFSVECGSSHLNFYKCGIRYFELIGCETRYLPIFISYLGSYLPIAIPRSPGMGRWSCRLYHIRPSPFPLLRLYRLSFLVNHPRSPPKHW